MSPFTPSRCFPCACLSVHLYAVLTNVLPPKFFPPKTEEGTANLLDRLQRMATLNPAWVSITWGAGGSTQARSLDLAAAALEIGLDVCLHVTCTNMERQMLDDTLNVSVYSVSSCYRAVLIWDRRRKESQGDRYPQSACSEGW
jgi:hypothetical protein